MIRYCITDRKQGDVIETAHRAVGNRIQMLQVREKDLEAAALLELVEQVVGVAKGTETQVLVNDRLDVALAAGARGVHLPASGLPVSIVRPYIGLIGASTHSVAEAKRAEAGGADFVVFGPVFDTPGKATAGLTLLGEVCQAVKIPVLAIGGVNEENALVVTGAGASGIAGIRMFQTRR